MIVEMAGSPPNHVKESLSKHIMILNEVKDVKVHTIKISEPAEIKDSKGIYTCYAEADFETENFMRMAETMFDFMPSSVEIIEPGKVSLDMSEATALLNNLSGRLHRYDDIAKVAKMKIDQMTRELEIVRSGSGPKKIEAGLGQKEIEEIRNKVKTDKKKVEKKQKKK